MSGRPLILLRTRYERDRNGSSFSVGWDVLYQLREAGRERKVGFIDSTRTRFYTWRDQVKHRSTVAGGYGIDVALMDYFDSVPSLSTIAITVRFENGRVRTYFTSMYGWLFNAKRFTLSEEFGEQVFLTDGQLDEADRIYRRAQEHRPSRLTLPVSIQTELPV